MTTAAERTAERRVDDVHYLACRMPTKTAIWFMCQELAEAEFTYFRSGDRADLAYVRRLEKSLKGST